MHDVIAIEARTWHVRISPGADDPCKHVRWYLGVRARRGAAPDGEGTDPAPNLTRVHGRIRWRGASPLMSKHCVSGWAFARG